MNCDSATLAMNALLDHELSDSDRVELERHLSECGACREVWTELRIVDEDLKLSLRQESIEPSIQKVMSVIRAGEPRSSTSSTIESSPTLFRGDNYSARDLSRSRRTNALPRFQIFLLGLTILAVFFASQIKQESIAEVTIATGSIEIRREGSDEWVASKSKGRIVLPRNARVRTRENSLCEIRTSHDALVRLNQKSELVVHEPERIELVSGELWCKAPTSTPLTISSEKAPAKNQFACPEKSETQWQALPDRELCCTAVSSDPVEIAMANSASCTINPGEMRSFDPDTNPSELRHADLLVASGWQLPLLILKKPDDPELLQRLTRLLAAVGETKMSYFYEDQIRQLGPAGTLPLLAYVQSADSLKRPELRHRAMRIIADLAPRSTLSTLKLLSKDRDEIVRELATKGVNRIHSDK